MDVKTYTKYIAEDKSEHDTSANAEARNEWLSFRKAYKEVDPGMFSWIEGDKYLNGGYIDTQAMEFINKLQDNFQTLREAFKRFEDEN